MQIVVKDPDGGFAIFEDEAAGFTFLKLSESRAKDALIQKFEMRPEEAAAVMEAAKKTGKAEWKSVVDRIRAIFKPAADAHPCVVQALAKALELRLNGIRKNLGANAV